MAITATFVALAGTTGADGMLTTSRAYGSAQPVSGRVRKSSSQPYFQTADISDVIDTSLGLTATIVLISDE